MLLLDVNRSEQYVRRPRRRSARSAFDWPCTGWPGCSTRCCPTPRWYDGHTTAASPLRAFVQGVSAVLRAPLLIVAVSVVTMLVAVPFAIALGSRVQASLASQPPVALDGNRNRSGVVAGISRAGARARGHVHAGRARVRRGARRHQRGPRWTPAAPRGRWAAGAVDPGLGVSLGWHPAAAFDAGQALGVRAFTAAGLQASAAIHRHRRHRRRGSSWSCI